jgi:hypothetical protein
MIDVTEAAGRLGLAPTGQLGAERLGQRMAALYRMWSGSRGIDLPALASCLLEPLGGTRQPIGAACLAAAASVVKWGGHPYHSVLHHAEVATNAAILAELMAALGQPLSLRHRALLLAAALSHDYLYQSGRPRFAAESTSAEAMDAIASGCGVATLDRADLCRLILATEPGFRRVLRGADIQPQDPVPALLRSLHARPELAQVATLLSDADVLSSAGLTLRWKQVQHRRLEQEFGRAIHASEDLAFLDQIVGPEFVSAGGRYFTPNLKRIRAACAVDAGALDHG